MHEAWYGVFSICLCAAGMMLVQHLAGASVRAIPGVRHGATTAGGIPLAGHLMAGLAGGLVCVLFLLLTARPAMAALITLSIQILLLFLNRIKVGILREPLVLADAWLLGQVFTYPEMYFPFLPVRQIVAGLAGICLGIVVLLYVEPPSIFLGMWRTRCLLLSLLGLTLCIYALLCMGKLPGLANLLLHGCPVSNDAKEDALRNGALTSALLHPVAVGMMRHAKPGFLVSPGSRSEQSSWPVSLERAMLHVAHMPASERPHVVIVQAESFCDVREFVAEEYRDQFRNFLPNWDKLKKKSGTLPTIDNAFGAYTMRMEFKVLTGLCEKTLGSLAFNPYLLAARRPLWSLARHFSSCGYASICLHPYHRKFFRRDKVMPNLGFDAFHALPELERLEKFGPYASDAALAAELKRILSESDKPVFCFCITVEAHGPWLEGRLTEAQIAETLPDLDYRKFSPAIQMYLCHLRHMDDFLGMLMNDNSRETFVWAYGDHPPSLDWTDCNR